MDHARPDRLCHRDPLNRPFMHRSTAALLLPIGHGQRFQIGAMPGQKALLPVGPGAPGFDSRRDNAQIVADIGCVDVQPLQAAPGQRR